ncbi:tRNA lysidine(34) synthetase TilS [Sphingobacterium athyrii]|uniref:tRNA(Ile)-lysidine synthase n=1 Tax=Sphingobacterium athyrii TaxID=2152717 RepID=A0A363NNE4_9SPHI|nr:tRNA lysidine(34) synthetase TilS [Sphingobacterium athyrii]PUV22304.1 tRNA lysidine(34) synthetase TilS [Sphingobacterium athyrii]
MNVLERLKGYIEKEHLMMPHDKILLTVSGGKDSMLMAHLFAKAGFNIAIAHCNFQLRGEDSELDEALVRKFAADNGIPIFVNQFDTKTYAKENQISIQMAARELRYRWFEQLREQLQFDRIAVAQHLNDHIETVLLNLSRGTGLQGLQGILPVRGRIIRPLLFLKASEIEYYVQEYSIAYRDDQSNFSTKYARNKIRIDIIPHFKKLQPDFEQIFEQNITHFKESYQLLQQFVEPIRNKLFRSTGDGWVVRKEDLEEHLNNLPLLYELFSGFNFSKAVLSDLQQAWGRESGRIFQSDCYHMLLDRNELFIKEKEFISSDEAIITSETSTVEWKQYCFHAGISTELTINTSREIAKFDYDLLVFPLTIRSWKIGDSFYPLGMDGRKKLSDFFINKKISLFEKENIPILVNGNGDILWLAKYRMDNRYKITSNTKKVLTLVCKCG